MSHKTTQKHLLARLRRLGHGIWRITFVVEGYDEEFVMFQRGDVNEKLAVASTAQALADALKTKRKFVIHSKTEFETP